MPSCGEFGGQLLLDRDDDFPILPVQIVEPRRDHRVGIWHEMAKCQIVEFVAHPSCMPMRPGERRIDIEGFLGDPPPFVQRHEMQRAHIMQAVGELDERHANVFNHGQEQLTEVFRLSGPLREKVERHVLGQSVDKKADIAAEKLVDFLARQIGVLDRVVQHRGDDRRVVELHVGQDGGDFERVGKIGIAGGPLLRAMRLHGVNIGAIEQDFVGVRVIATHPVDEFILPHHDYAGPRQEASCHAPV